MSVIRTSDGFDLAVQRLGDPTKPTAVLVHGFPDDHTVWDGVAGQLVDDFHLVTYDVRGAGASSRPPRITDYRLDQLADDLQAVIDHVGGEVHLVGHDWGSVQGWHLVTDRAHRGVRSFTSISGPCLDHVRGWIGRRARARQWSDIASIWKSPLYLGAFQLPVVAALMCRLGVVDATIAGAIKAFERPEALRRRPAGPNARANAASIRMYAANLGPRLARGDRGGTTVPVQVLTPSGDVFIPPVSQRDPHPDVAAHLEQVPGGHWAPAYNPTAIAEHVRTWIDKHRRITK